MTGSKNQPYRKSILLVDSYPTWGGGQTVHRAMVQALSDCDVGVIRPLDTMDAKEWEGQTLYRMPFSNMSRNLRYPWVFARALPGILRTARHLRRIINTHQPDEIIVGGLFLMIPLVFALPFIRKKASICIYAHTLDAPLHFGTRFLANKSDTIIFVSEAARTRFPPCRARKQVVIHNPVRCPAHITPRSSRQNPLRIGYLGRLSDEKNLFALVDAVAQLHHAVPCTLQVAGDGPLRVNLEQFVTNRSATDYVLFPGWQTDIATFFNKIDVLCLPSLMESFGMVLVEAHAHGVPVIATPVGAISEVVTDTVNGVVAASTSSQDIAVAIKRFIALDYAQLSANAIENAKRFDYESVYVPAIRRALLE